MDSLRELASRLDEAAATMTSVARAVSTVDLGQTALGADEPGRPGELGRALYAQWVAATLDRSREATDLAHQLADVAAAVRVAAAGYADVDQGSARRLPGEA
ncbi:hypothetical protein GCM10027290_49620 [Micromonospora sonneratiae]|uniref:Excreted virulence factor EspC, type VII ESX diderm n=1 Tax=Micromonospora sonneratiae TaxID=1184706 RepID=A0ABW3YMT6_9ACTN